MDHYSRYKRGIIVMYFTNYGLMVLAQREFRRRFHSRVVPLRSLAARLSKGQYLK